ncbi:hypothetical protein LSAT2_004546 [Lamellibrachia satsuma]|nr:hypothetical protein LSAT2_004546 [Lamellibrachia satsuma]
MRTDNEWSTRTHGLATSVYLVDRIPWYTARPNCRVYAQPHRKDLTVTHFYEQVYVEPNMAVINRFQDNDYVNWIKAGQALQCTKEGLSAFCEGPIKQYHLTLHNKFPCQPCIGVCGWETDYWEIAKVFMEPGKNDPSIAGPADTDAIGLLQLVINCDLFDGCIISRQRFKDVKDMRNKLFHAAVFKLDNNDLKARITEMIALLEDPVLLINDVLAQAAVTKLRQIEVLPLDINDSSVLAIERNMWKQELQSLKQQQSLTSSQLNPVIQFVSQQEALNKYLKDNIHDLVQRLKKGKRRMDNLEGDLEKLRLQLKGAQQRLVERNVRKKRKIDNNGVQKLSEIYVDLRIHDNDEHYKRLETRTHHDNLQLSTGIEGCRKIEVRNLFVAERPDSATPVRCLVVGKAGIGKTMLSMHVLDMWLNGELPADIKFVFFFPLRNLSCSRKYSLKELFFLHQLGVTPNADVTDEFYQFLSTDADKILMILDGLDEIENLPMEKEPFDLNTPVEMPRLISSIIKGYTLKNTRLLVTSRPGAVIDYDAFDIKAEIYGFTRKMMSNYIEKFCGRRRQFEKRHRRVH